VIGKLRLDLSSTKQYRLELVSAHTPEHKKKETVRNGAGFIMLARNVCIAYKQTTDGKVQSMHAPLSDM